MSKQQSKELSPETKQRISEGMAAKWAARKEYLVNCSECCAPMVTRFPEREGLTCSPKCKGVKTRRRSKTVLSRCSVCGGAFLADKYAKQKGLGRLCGTECRNANFRMSAAFQQKRDRSDFDLN